MNDRNLTLLTDFYELTMGNGYLENGLADTVCCFDLYFRKVPDNGGFAVMCGLEQAINYIKKLSFTDEDIAYLRDKKIFSEKFLDYLRNFKSSCDVWAIPEGTPVFPNEPLVIVKGPAIQAQLMETMLLLCINHQCLIATKAARIVKAADGRAVMEFGSRRAQGSERYLRRKSCIYRRLCGNCLHHLRQGNGHSRSGNHGSQLGADVRF